MGLFKNTASQKVYVFAFDTTNNTAKTGDAANISAYISKDYGAVTQLGDTSATEVDSTNAKGLYVFDITQTETNADVILVSGKSSTANIAVIGAPAVIDTRPPNAGALSIDSNGRVDVIKIAGTTQTARDVGASVLLSSGTGTGQIDFTSGVVKANVTQFNGSNGTFSSGRPEVNTSHIAGSAVSTSSAQIGVNVVNVGGSAVSASSGLINANVTQISGDATAADNAESYFDGTGYGEIMVRTTIASLSSQTSFTLTAGSADDSAYKGCVIVIEDASTAAQKAVGVISAYTGASKTVTLLNDPGVFTMATTDVVTIIADRALKATVDNRTLDVSAGGEAGVDWSNIGSPTTAVNLSGTTVKTATDVETDTQDIQSRLPAALVNSRMDCTIDGTGMETGAVDAILNRDASASTTNSTLGAIINDWEDAGRLDAILDARASQTSVDTIDDFLDAEVAAILADTNELQTDWANGGRLDLLIDAIKAKTDNLPSDPADASDIAAATNSILARLKGLVIHEGTVGDTGNDTTHVHLEGLAYGNDEINDHILVIFDNSASLYYATRVTDWTTTGDLATVSTLPFTPQNDTDTYHLLSLKATSGGSGATAQEVWEYATRTLTAIDEDSTTLDLDATIRGAVGLASANVDTQLADIEGKVDDLESRLGTPSDLGGGATIAQNLADIEAQTDDIGSAGAGLSAIPWNAAWDAEVQSEATDALNAYDPPTRAEATSDKNEILAKIQGFILESGTIGGTGNDTTHVHLDAFTYGNDEINNYLLVIYDASEDEYHARYIEDWVNASKLATVATLPFTPQNSTDGYFLLPFRQDVTGGAGLDAAGVRAAIGLASANLDTQLADIEGKVDDVETRLGTPSDLGSGATVAANLVDIEGQTDNLPSIETKIDTIDTIVDAIKAKTDNLPSDPADASVIAGRFDTVDSALTTIDGNVDAILADTGTDGVIVATNNDKTGYGLTSAYDFARGTIAMTESYAAQGDTMSPVQALYQINQHLGESSISGTTKTVKKRNGSTTAKQFTLDSSTSPTSITESS